MMEERGLIEEKQDRGKIKGERRIRK